MTSNDTRILEKLNLAIPEDIDWSNLPWNDDNDERGFTRAQRQEISLFRKQERFAIAKQQRLAAYQQKVSTLQSSFERAEAGFDRNIVNPFSLSIWNDDIQETRKRAVPAYAFDRFPDLPKELQLMIWSKTIEIGETKTHILMSMSAKDWNINEHQINVHNPPGSTSILRPYYRGYGPSLNEGPTFLSQVCPDAHKAYQNVYSYMSCRTGEGSRLATYFYNTWSDEYYLGEREWTDFKILIDMIIIQNTTRPLKKSLASDVAALQSIRHLTVDLNIFGGAPASIWRQFNRLAVLTIAFYPFDTIEDRDRSVDMDLDPYEDTLDAACNLVFTKPRRNKKLLKRAETISKIAMASLNAVALEFPGWKIPRLEVVVKKSGIQRFDHDAEHYDKKEVEEEVEAADTMKVVLGETDAFEGGQELNEVEGNDSYQESEIEEDDSAFLNELPRRMSHPPLPMGQVKRWKQRFHPSRERSYMEGSTEQVMSDNTRRSGISYYADSEGGSDDERPFQILANRTTGYGPIAGD